MERTWNPDGPSNRKQWSYEKQKDLFNRASSSFSDRFQLWASRGIKEISILLTNLKSFIIDSSLALSILATLFGRIGNDERDEARQRVRSTRVEGWKRGCKRTEWGAETKTKAPSTLGCPIERIDASTSEIFSKELTPLSSPGIDASTFFFPLVARSPRSFYLQLNAREKLLLTRNSTVMSLSVNIV